MADLYDAVKQVVKAATHHAEVLKDHELRIQELERRGERAVARLNSDPEDLSGEGVE